jgi:hypothetical protein
MKNAAMLALLASALTTGALAQSDPISLSDVTTGSVVRVSARRPLVNLGHATVLACTTNELVVRQSKQTYTIRVADLLDFAMLERAESPAIGPGQEDQPAATPATQGNKASGQSAKGASPPPSGLAAVWAKIASFWR